MADNLVPVRDQLTRVSIGVGREKVHAHVEQKCDVHKSIPDKARINAVAIG